MNSILAKRDTVSFEDRRCSFRGNAFHSGVVPLLFAPLFHGLGPLKTRPTPSDIVARMHLPAGESFIEGAVYDRAAAKQRAAHLDLLRSCVHLSAEVARQ